VNSAGTASSALVLTMVAVGAAAGVSIRSDGEYVPPLSAVHRDPPGPAQIELVDAATASVPGRAPAPVPPAIPLLGVDVASAISDPCGDGATSGTLVSVNVVCAFVSRTIQHEMEFALLLLGTEYSAG
jgi:hypothetical protein